MWLDFQIEGMKREREVALKMRDRLERMKEDKDEFLNKLREARKNVHKVRNGCTSVVRQVSKYHFMYWGQLMSIRRNYSDCCKEPLKVTIHGTTLLWGGYNRGGLLFKYVFHWKISLKIRC